MQIYAGLIRDNYIHDVSFADSGSHLNGTTSNGSTVPLRIVHNTVFNPNDQTDAISLFEDFGVEANVIIDNNLVAGGGYAIYGGQNPADPRPTTSASRTTGSARSTTRSAARFGYIAAFDRQRARQRLVRQRLGQHGCFGRPLTGGGPRQRDRSAMTSA